MNPLIVGATSTVARNDARVTVQDVPLMPFRLWIRNRGHLVRLTFRQNETVYYGFVSDDDIETSYQRTWWRIDEQGIYLDSESGGRDCDGVHRDRVSLFCRHENRHTLDATNDLEQLWDELKSDRFDAYAQAANY